MIWTYLPIALSVVSLIVIVCMFLGWRAESKLHKSLLETATEKFNKTNKELASVRVKHGQAWEVFLPIMETFEEQLGSKNDAIFLGQPIDLMYFKEDEILFVEVKTGNSRLSRRQRNFKELVKKGKIRWVEVSDDLKFVSQEKDDEETSSTGS